MAEAGRGLGLASTLRFLFSPFLFRPGLERRGTLSLGFGTLTKVAPEQRFSAMLFIRITWGVFKRSQCLGLLQSKGLGKRQGFCLFACLRFLKDSQEILICS